MVRTNNAAFTVTKEQQFMLKTQSYLPCHSKVSEVVVWPQHYCNIVSNPVTREEVSGAVTHMDSATAEVLRTFHT